MKLLMMMMLLLVLAFDLVNAADCEALFHRDVVLVRDALLVDNIAITTRSGIVVVETFNETEPFNISVVVRFTGSTEAALSKVVERITTTDSSISVIACEAEGSDNDCSSERTRNTGSVVHTDECLAVLLASAMWPFLGVAAASTSDDCTGSAITVTVPHGWRGSLSIVTESGNIALNKPANFSSLSLETWSGAVASTWESPIKVDGSVSINLHEQSSTLFLARLTLTGSSGRSKLESSGSGDVTFSFVDFPDQQIPVDVSISVDDGGYFGIPNLRNADGTFVATLDVAGGEVSFGGNVVYTTNGATRKSGTIATGTGLHKINAVAHVGGSIVVWCKKPE